jgi:tetratricopeptide (TPR) repeat protein
MAADHHEIFPWQKISRVCIFCYLPFPRTLIETEWGPAHFDQARGPMKRTTPQPRTLPKRILIFIGLLALPVLSSCTKPHDDIRSLQQEVWQHPGDTGALMNLANAFARAKRYDEAAEAYSGALKIDPELDAAYHSLGAVRFNQERYSEARDWFRKHLDRAPTDSLRNYDLGNALMQLKDYGRAAEAYEAAIANSRSFTEAHYNLAVCFTHLDRMAEARQIYDWLLDKNNYLAVSLQSHLKGGKPNGQKP